ncbi:MAG: glycosidase [Sphingomonadales bacterium]|nr:glycosidase [Sphingomonadales bacterium]
MATVGDSLAFSVEAIDRLQLDRGGELAARDLMSPFVWRRDDGTHAMLVRGVPPNGVYTTDTGMIWYGESHDGLAFTMRDAPVLAPGPDFLDAGGCEDPTLAFDDDRNWVVTYTGVDYAHVSGQLLYATGTGPDDLVKRGVALASTKTAGNTKEATIGRTTDGRWRLYYEFASQEHSLIGLALGDSVAGPWHEQPHPFDPRPDHWDGWHLSTGPMWTADPHMPIMFYNGATHDAHWRIGWVAFDADYTRVIARGDDPLIVPKPHPDLGGVDIAFAASCIDLGDGRCHLYYSIEDRYLERATIRRTR